jgi:SAM-dependent methyltransferase
MADENIWNRFILDVRQIPAARILELGTCRSQPDKPTISRGLFPGAADCIGTDFQAGLDVDVVADAHSLSSAFAPESFDAIISLSTFEHLKYPFLAAHEILKCLKVGGRLFIQTHQTFHLHAYPSDYFRFSTEALAAMFPPQMGFRVDGTLHEFPAEIRSVLGTTSPAFLNACIFGTKVAPTPDDFIYDLPGLFTGAPAPLPDAPPVAPPGLAHRVVRKLRRMLG